MTLLENWRKSATRRAEFAALLQEDCMQEAIAILKEIIFTPLSPPPNMTQTERMSWFGEMGLRREAHLAFLYNFTSLATLHPMKAQAQELQKKKPWETADRKAGEAKILSDFYGGNPPPLEGATGPTDTPEEPVLPVSAEPEPQPPQQ
jgi:hypothetical protein